MISPKGLTFLSQAWKRHLVICEEWIVVFIDAKVDDVSPENDDHGFAAIRSGRSKRGRKPPNVKAKTLFSLLADVAARLTANILTYQSSNISREISYSIFKVSWSPRKALACSHLELRPRNRIPLPLDTPTRCLWVKVEYILTQKPVWFKVLFLSLFMNQFSRCVWLWAAIAVAVTVPKKVGWTLRSMIMIVSFCLFKSL